MKHIRIKGSNETIAVGKVVCLGKNYAEHAKEMGGEVLTFPLVFLKTATCLISSGEKVIHPTYSNNMHHEIELILLIGKDVRNATANEAEEAIAGYGVGLDMTLRDLQKEAKEKGEPWTLAKVFDTSAVISPITLKKEYQLKGSEKIFLNVNAQEKQNSTLDKMLFNIVETVQHISSKMTLEKGDLIFTGTPAGVSRVTPGDKIKGGIENIGEIETEII